MIISVNIESYIVTLRNNMLFELHMSTCVPDFSKDYTVNFWKLQQFEKNLQINLVAQKYEKIWKKLTMLWMCEVDTSLFVICYHEIYIYLLLKTYQISYARGPYMA